MVETRFYTDRAIADFSEDLFDRAPFVQRLASALISRDGKATGGVVGLVGEWGAGKTSILNLLGLHLEEAHPQAVVVIFSPWLITTRDQLLTAFFREIISSLNEKFGRDGEPYSNRFEQLLDETVEALRQYGNALSPLVDKIPKIGFAAGIAFNWIEKLGKDRESLTHKKRILEQKLHAIQKPIVVIIDELDRVEDDEVRLMAQLVRSVMDFREISYLLAYDQQRVSEALGTTARDGKASIDHGKKYLEKIVQLQVRVPPLMHGELRELAFSEIQKVIKRENLIFGTTTRERMTKLIQEVIPGFLSTYRSVKRVTNDFSLRMSMIAEEVSPADVLGFIILDILSPKSIDKIPNAWSSIVFDGNDSYDQLFKEAAAGNNGVDLWCEKIDPTNQHPSLLKWLLGFLFPALSKTRSQDRSDPDDIAFRRPLLTLMRLSPAIGSITKQDIVAFSAMPGAAKADCIRKIITENKLTSFIQRLTDVYADVHGDHFDTWYTLCHTIETSNENFDFERQLVIRAAEEDLARAMIRLAERLADVKSALPQILIKLVEDRSFYTAARIYTFLNRRIRESGNNERAKRNAPLSADRLDNLRERIISEARAVIDKDGYSSIRSAFLLYFLEEFKAWTPKDRDKYTKLISEQRNALDQFVFMQFGGNYGADRSSINSIIHYETFETCIKKRLSELRENQDSSLLLKGYKRAVEFLNIDASLS